MYVNIVVSEVLTMLSLALDLDCPSRSSPAPPTNQRVVYSLLLGLFPQQHEWPAVQQAVDEVFDHRCIPAEVEDSLARLKGHGTLYVVQRGGQRQVGLPAQ